MRILLQAASLSRLVKALAKSPGSDIPIHGDLINGYFGVVPESELISAMSLTNMVNASKIGSVANYNVDWLKFSVSGRIIYIAQKAYRHSLSVDMLSSAGLVNSDKPIELETGRFKLNCPSAADTVPSTMVLGGDWLKTIARLLPGREWATFTLAQLGFGANGDLAISKENVNASNHVVVGGGSGLNLSQVGKNGVSAAYGWRPVLEWVNPTDSVIEPVLIQTQLFQVSGSAIPTATVKDPFWLPVETTYQAELLTASYDIQTTVLDGFSIPTELTYSSELLTPVYDVGATTQ